MSPGMTLEEGGPPNGHKTDPRTPHPPWIRFRFFPTLPQPFSFFLNARSIFHGCRISVLTSKQKRVPPSRRSPRRRRGGSTAGYPQGDSPTAFPRGSPSPLLRMGGSSGPKMKMFRSHPLCISCISPLRVVPGGPPRSRPRCPLSYPRGVPQGVPRDDLGGRGSPKWTQN